MKSKLSTSSLFEYGVPSILTNLFIGTDSGCSSMLQSTSINLSLSRFSSPRPKIPPVQTFMPASLTYFKVFNLSLYVLVDTTLL